MYVICFVKISITSTNKKIYNIQNFLFLKFQNFFIIKKMKKGKALGVLNSGNPTASPKRSTQKGSKAKQHFSSYALPPLPKIQYPKTSVCLSPVSRPDKPPEELLLKYDPDAPLAQIENITNKIGKIFVNFEANMENEDNQLRSQFENQFFESDIKPMEIVNKSKTIVDDLFTKSKDLNDSQLNVIGDVSNWLKNEDTKVPSNSLVTVDPEFLNADISDNLNEDEKSEKVMKILSIHTDIVSKAQIKIQQLTRKIDDQKRVINELQSEIEKKVKPSEPMVLKSEYDKVNEQLKNEINKNSVMENLLNDANKRIDELIAKPMNIVMNENNDDKAQLEKNYKLSQMELMLEKVKETLANSTEEKNKILLDKTKLERINESLEDRIKTLEEQLVLNEKNFNLQLAEINEITSSMGSAKQLSSPTKSRSKFIDKLKAETLKLQQELANSKEEMTRRLGIEIDKVAAQFKEKEIAMKEQYAAKINSMTDLEKLNELHKVEDDKRRLMEENHGIEMKELNAAHKTEMDELKASYEARIEDLQKQLDEMAMESAGDKSAEIIERIKNECEKKTLALEQEFHDKSSIMRQDQIKYKAKCDQELLEKDALLKDLTEHIQNLTAQVDELESINSKLNDKIDELCNNDADNEKNKEKNDKKEEEDDEQYKLGRHESEILKLKSSFKETMMSKVNMLKKQYSEEHESLREQIEAEHKAQMDAFAKAYEEKIAVLEGKLSAAEQSALLFGSENADSSGNSEEELKGQIMKLMHENEMLVSKNSALLEGKIDDVTQSHIKNLEETIAKKDKEIAFLSDKITFFKRKARYVGLDASPSYKLEFQFFNADPLHVSNDPVPQPKPEINWQIDSNICYSIAPLRDITKEERANIENNQPPSFASATTNTEIKMYRDTETLTGTGKKAMLRICLDPSNGYVFIEKMESKEQANDESTDFVPLVIDFSHDGVVSIERPEIIPLKVVSLKQTSQPVSLMISPIPLSYNVFVDREEELSSKLSINETVSHSVSKSNSEDNIEDREQVVRSPIILTDEETLTEGKYVLEKMLPKVNNNSSSTSKKYSLETLNSLLILSELNKEEPVINKSDDHEVDEKPAPLQPYVIEKENLHTRHSNLMLRPLELSIADSTTTLPRIAELCDEQTQSENAKLSLVNSMKIIIPPTIKTVDETNENIQNTQKEEQKQAHFTKVPILIMQTSSEDIEPKQKASVCCQIDLVETPKIATLHFMYPTEIFSIESETSFVTPDEAPIVQPLPSFTKPEEKRLKLVTSNGDVVQVPPRNEIIHSNDPRVLEVGKQIVTNEANAISKKLSIVVSEMHSIDTEQDTTKKNQLLATVGFQLDIEKDSLVSEMKEKVTELEQINKKEKDLKNKLAIKPSSSFTRPVKIEATYSFSSNPLFTKDNSDIIKADPKPALSSDIQWTLNEEKAQPTFTTSAQEEFYVSAEPKKRLILADVRSSSSYMEMKDRKIMEQEAEISQLKKLLDSFGGGKGSMEIAKEISEKANDLLNDAINTISKEEPTIIIKDDAPAPTSKNPLDLKSAFLDASEMSNILWNSLNIENENKQPVLDAINEAINALSKKVTDGEVTNVDIIDFMKAISDIIAHIKTKKLPIEKPELQARLDRGMEYVGKQEEIVKELRKQINDLREFTDTPSSFQLIYNMEKDLNNLLDNKDEENTLFHSYKEAQSYILNVGGLIRKDNAVLVAGAGLDAKDLSELVDRAQPQWFEVKNKITAIREKMEENIRKERNGQLIMDLKGKVDSLENELSDSRTQFVLNEKERLLERKELNEEIDKLKSLYENAQKFNEMLVENQKNLKQKDDTETLQAQRQHEIDVEKMKQHHREMEEKIMEINNLKDEKAKLEGLLAKTKQSFKELFNSQADSQNDHLMNEARLDEMMKQNETAQSKVVSLEQILDVTNKENERLRNKIDELNDKVNEQSNNIIMLQDEISKGENTKLSEKVKEIVENDATDKTSKIIRMYQQKVDSQQSLLDSRGREIIKLNNRRASYQREISIIKAELSRLKTTSRLQIAKYNSAKEEAGTAWNAVKARDEIIKNLKREIARLRQMIEKLYNMKEISSITTQETTKLLKSVIKGTPVLSRGLLFKPNRPAMTTNKYDAYLLRDHDRLNKLELKRREIKDRTEKQKIMLLKDTELLARKQELQLPEQLVIKLMPKPKPAQKVEMQKIAKEQYKRENVVLSMPQPTISNNASSKFAYREPSYADRLAAIGQLDGKISKEEMRSLLTNAKHKKILIPASKFNEDRTIPSISGKHIV